MVALWASSTIPVSIGWTWGTTFQAITAVLTTLLGGGFLAAWFNTRPALQKIANEREAARASAKREDIDKLNDRILLLETKVEAANAAAHTAEMRLVHAVAAVQLLAAKIRADNPNDPTLKQAADLLAAASTGGIKSWAADLASGLDKIKGVGE